MKTVFLIVGETSSGKDSLAAALCNDLKLNQLKSYATRPRRQNEGETHIFINGSEVESYKEDMIAYTKIGQFEYFSTIQQLYDSDLYVIDPAGIDYMKNVIADKHIDDIRFVTIYINSPYEERCKRALGFRKDNPEVYLKRVIDEYNQFMCFRSDAKFDYAIYNKEFNKAFTILKNIVITESK